MLKAGFLMALLLCAQQALAQRVYVTQGEFGEASFSDVALPGSQAMDLVVGDPSAEDVQRSRQRARVTADLAAELADARQARAEDRARQRSAAETPPPVLPPETAEVRYLYPYVHRPLLRGPGFGLGRGHFRRAPHVPKGSPQPRPEEMSPGFKSKWIANSASRE